MAQRAGMNERSGREREWCGVCWPCTWRFGKANRRSLRSPRDERTLTQLNFLRDLRDLMFPDFLLRTSSCAEHRDRHSMRPRLALGEVMVKCSGAEAWFLRGLRANTLPGTPGASIF